ncbi:MAG: response regulator [Elusimicrobia bacterium]|nr:response regulator [Elusimicrobiota bacterium]
MNKKIMIVDDDKEFLEELKEVLILSGYKVEVSDGAAFAFEMIDTAKPDIILLDLNMPNKSGFEIATELKYSPKYKNIPVVAISGFAKDEHYISLMDICGIKTCLEKPLNPLEVIAKIEGY